MKESDYEEKVWRNSNSNGTVLYLTVVSVYADDGKGQNPDYVTDYYMIVQSTQAG